MFYTNVGDSYDVGFFRSSVSGFHPASSPTSALLPLLNSTGLVRSILSIICCSVSPVFLASAMALTLPSSLYPVQASDAKVSLSGQISTLVFPNIVTPAEVRRLFCGRVDQLSLAREDLCSPYWSLFWLCFCLAAEAGDIRVGAGTSAFSADFRPACCSGKQEAADVRSVSSSMALSN